MWGYLEAKAPRQFKGTQSPFWNSHQLLYTKAIISGVAIGRLTSSITALSPLLFFRLPPMVRSKKKAGWDPEEVRANPVKKHPNGMLNPTPWGKWVAISETNWNEAPLLRLPPEIRNRIYTFVLSGYTGTIEYNGVSLKITRRRVEDKGAGISREGLPNIFSILRVCRQIYSEAALTPVRLTAFRGCYVNPYCFPWSTGSPLLRRFQREGIAVISFTLNLPHDICLNIQNIVDILRKMPRTKQVILKVRQDGFQDIREMGEACKAELAAASGLLVELVFLEGVQT
ncbi:hypothetical protein P154DRAFT_578878 [Amniculicola lignicola CBS 123094]|uniref:Uncharacterized protein n=1 Tax=Amniculicola lignicola CBS 123094 TaxID=1392246 RepID=A0A6A5W7W5_9PLEO|nr:hypothetical protein P154DRAFT_578878 [Amniculicola lignicola CBS 123094]